MIDSDSTDDDLRGRHRRGRGRAPFARDPTGIRHPPGKGEAMWQSLFVTRGDLIVFMDADLVDWDTHFVRGPRGRCSPVTVSPW